MTPGAGGILKAVSMPARAAADPGGRLTGNRARPQGPGSSLDARFAATTAAARLLSRLAKLVALRAELIALTERPGVLRPGSDCS